MLKLRQRLLKSIIVSILVLLAMVFITHTRIDTINKQNNAIIQDMQVVINYNNGTYKSKTEELLEIYFKIQLKNSHIIVNNYTTKDFLSFVKQVDLHFYYIIQKIFE